MSNSQTTSGERTGDRDGEVVDWTDLGKGMWDFLTGREAAIHYRLEDMTVEVPRDTGADAPRAVWKLDGVLTITTGDNANGSSTSGTSGTVSG